MKKVLVVPDPHAHPDYPNDRADWLGQFIKETKPDVVVNMGDAADMASLSSYDRGKASFHGRNYEKDINSHLDFQERMWGPMRRSKKKQPYRVVLEGNHETRLKRALEQDPQLAGDKFGISFRNYDFDTYYNEVIEYDGQTPGVWEYQNISFAHYLVSGLMGRPIGGEHHAYSLIAKHHCSCVVTHSHTADFAMRTDIRGKHMFGLVAGVYQDYIPQWCGQAGKMWWQGLVMLNSVEDGYFDPNFISLKQLKKEYSR